MPSDDGMDQALKAYHTSIKERISNARTSILAMAAPLESSGSSGAKTKATPAAEPTPQKDPPQQRIGLLKALLAIGALRPGFAMLSQHPWLVDAHPDTADLLNRIISHSLEPLFLSKYPKSDDARGFSVPRPKLSPGGVTAQPVRKYMLTLWAPTPPSTATNDFVFFFPNWTERIPICSTTKDLEIFLQPIIHFAGLHISRDPLLLAKLVRLGRSHLVRGSPF